MRTIRVSLKERSYDIHIGNGILERTGELLRGIARSPAAVVISNSKIMRLHGQTLLKSLHQSGFAVRTLIVPDGESHKQLSTVEAIYGKLANYHADRKTWLIAFGGGVIGDMAGFAAATYLRGLPFVQIPTTLLGQIDSAIGGKTGVNLRQGKNLVGAFYQPGMVIADPLLLLTLPRREFLSGIYEALKCGVIWDASLFRLIDRKHPLFPDRDQKNLERMIAACAAIKAKVVSKDERESELRMVLNFGHTFGHALEAVTGYKRFTHGEAVGHGMIMATQLAVKLDTMKPGEALRLQQAVARISPLPCVQDLDPRQIFRHLLSDKKILNQELRFVLPRKIGRVEILRNTPRKTVEEVICAYLPLGPGTFQC